jgi:hypothetical protein
LKNTDEAHRFRYRHVLGTIMAGRFSSTDNAFRLAKSQEDGLSSPEAGAVSLMLVLLVQAARWPGLKLIGVFNFDRRLAV